MAAVSLHPLASRSGTQSATVVSVTLPSCDQVEDSHATPRISCEEGGTQSARQFFQHHNYSSSATTRALSPNPFSELGHGHVEDKVHPASRNDHDVRSETEGKWEQDPSGLWLEDGEEWGIEHQDLEQYPVLLEGDDQKDDRSPPIRAMTAQQFANLQRQYADLDVPHSVMFPFLHGVDGDNVAQNAFFRAPLSGQPTPHYRGLTILRADMPNHQQRFSVSHRKRTFSSASKLSQFTNSMHSRNGSISTSQSSFSQESSGSSGEEEDQKSSSPRPRTVTESHSASSMASSAACSDHSRNSSLFSRAMSSDTAATSSTCLDSSDTALKASEANGFHAQHSRLQHRHAHRRSGPYEPQPTHSLLNSTLLPKEILNPPLMANLLTNSLEVAQQSSPPSHDLCWVHGATFIKPKQAEGISLRNFKMQAIKYATVSDIVIYCPAGLHDGSLTLAQWARQAQEACWQERISKGLGGLRYNVFVIIDSFDVFEREQPHLIAVDAGGFSRNRVDFVEREREEMQRFTEASEIDEGVWMGCSANVPYAMEDEMEREGSSFSLESYLPHEVNPNAFSVCIEARDDAEMPSISRLNHASHYMDAFEATAMFEYTSKEALRELEEEDEDSAEEDDRPSLGPNGWSPAGRNKTSNHRRSMPTYNQHNFYPAPSSIVHFTAYGSGSSFANQAEEEEAIESIVNMCVWIKKQTCPTIKPAPASHVGILHGALRYGRTQSWPKGQQQVPRRILIHCSDGYTDTSILGLAYLMYSRSLTLPEAYLDLQNRCNRCFFVYEKDLPFLHRLSQRVATESKALFGSPERSRPSSHRSNQQEEPSHRSRRSNSMNRRFSNDDGNAEQSVWARGLAAATGLMSTNSGGKKSSASSKSSNGPLTNGGMATSVDMTRTNTPTPARKSTPTPSSPKHEHHGKKGSVSLEHRWFTNSNFQGSFPSKILPFLYLGNLSHAMNPAMLHAIGITHVVSVGESAMVPPDVEEGVLGAAAAVQCGIPIKYHRKKKGSFSNGCTSPSPVERVVADTLWEEERRGRISVLDLKNVSDDGIDSLRPHMKQAIEYIEQARLQGGKVLVHCRVGVSRSATICIAYVMAHCDLSMIESFLLVRSRRMNVLTQPTLLFVWEMRGFEAQLARLKEQRRMHLLLSRADEQGNDLVMKDSRNVSSFAALSISSASSNDSEYSRLNDRQGNREGQSSSEPSYPETDDLALDIGAGAGSVYGFQVKDYALRPYNSGSLTRLDYYSAKLTHGYFCKLLSELNARYNVA